MKAILIKYLFLSYTSRLFGKQFTYLRAIPVIVVALAFAVLATVYSWGALFWIPFGLFVFLTFPIVKDKIFNWAALVTTVFLVFISVWADHSWYEGLPFLYFSLGFLVRKTGFWFSVKYEDLVDWEQQYQYLTTAGMIDSFDQEEPQYFRRIQLVKDLKARMDRKYAPENRFINWKPLVIPIATITLLILILAIFGIEAFADRRFF